MVRTWFASSLTCMANTRGAPLAGAVATLVATVWSARSAAHWLLVGVTAAEAGPALSRATAAAIDTTMYRTWPP